jgi:pimeloyl-ACP methyl ester carboxylesterase
MKVVANSIDIEVEDTAEINPQDTEAYTRPVVLLIMGLGMQLIAWPPQLVDELVDAGFRVVRMDNRDIGLSQHFDALGTPNLVLAGIKYKLGLSLHPPYTLHDMAGDVLGVMDALEIERAHIVGVSMGGMIAQHVAIAAPQRVISLTSIMSSSGAKGLPQAHRDVTRVLFSRPASTELHDVVDHYVKLYRTIGSTGFPTPEPELRERITRAVQRSFHPAGTVRQMVAIMADRTRAAQLSAASRVPRWLCMARQTPGAVCTRRRHGTTHQWRPTGRHRRHGPRPAARTGQAASGHTDSPPAGSQTMNTPEQSQLGKSSAYIDQYDPTLLFPLPRAGKRAEIGITGTRPFWAPICGPRLS